MFGRPNLFRHWLLAGIFAAISLTAMAQTNEGQLAGNVLDQSGAAVPNATVTARNEATNSTYDTVSSSAGNYRFPSITLGRYTVTANAPSFKQSVSTGVEIQVNTTTSLNVTLSSGSASESVTVEADAPSVQTQSSEIGGVVTTRQIIELPLALGGVGALRSPEAFVFLIPGTTGPGTGNSGNGIFISKVAGGQNFGNEILVDGASQTRSENGSSFDEEAPSVEAISEFKVTTSTPQAEFGRTTGGVENYVTKSGTNTYHGTAFELFQNEALNANDWFSNGRLAQCAPGDASCRQANKRGLDKKNDFGGSIGGPLTIPHLYNAKDRTFGFFSWEQFRQTLSGPATSIVPSAAVRNGDFSSLLGAPVVDGSGQPVINPCTGQQIIRGQIFNPATSRTLPGATTPCRDPYANNVVTNVSAAGKALAAYIPLPNIAGAGPGVPNFVYNGVRPINDTTYSVRLDQTFTEKLKVFFSYTARENNLLTSGPCTFPAPADPSCTYQDFLTHFIRGGIDYAISPTLLNHVNLGFNRSNSINHSAAVNSGIQYTAKAGVANVNSAAFPIINFDGPEGYTNTGRQFNVNQDAIDNGYRFNDSLSWIKGRNSFKFGGDYRFQQFSAIFGTVPSFNFSHNQTEYSPSGTAFANTGNAFASLLAGTPNVASQNVVGHNPQWLSTYFAVFAQDDLKINNELTLNLGFRWDVDFPRHEKLNATSNFSSTALDTITTLQADGVTKIQGTHPGALAFGQKSGSETWVDTYFKDFSPRIGFAYSPRNSNGTTSVRGGYAILYGPLQYADFGSTSITGYTVTPTPTSKDGFTPAFALDAGFPTFAPPPNLDPSQLNFQSLPDGNPGGGALRRSFGRPANIQNWSLQVQQQLAKDLIMTIGYIGQRGTHLRSDLENINNIGPGNFVLGDRLTHPLNNNPYGIASPYNGFDGTQANSLANALRPFPQYFSIGTGNALQNIGQSSYHALVTSLERRFSAGLNLQASYTWAKNISNADSTLPAFAAQGFSSIQNPTNLRSEKSISAQDTPSTFVVSYLYELPVGRGKKFLGSTNHVVDLALGGWKVGGVQRYQSGQPIRFAPQSQGVPGWDNSLRLSRVPGSNLKSAAYASGRKINPFSPDPSVTTIFNPLAFFDQNATNSPAAIDPRTPRAARSSDTPDCLRANGCYSGAFLFGDLPRITGEIRSPKYLNEDFSLLKDFHFSDRAYFELKGEALNAFNRHVFAVPDQGPLDGNFGVPTGDVNSSRTLQITGRISF